MRTLIKVVAGVAAPAVFLVGCSTVSPSADVDEASAQPASAAAPAQQLPDTNEIAVSGRVRVISYSIQGTRIGPSTTAVRTSDGVVLIDVQLAPLGGLLQPNVTDGGTSTVTAVFNTHWHPDHTGGNATFTADAEIIAHENVREILSQPQEGFGLTAPGSHHNFPPVPEAALPERLVADRLEIEFGGVMFEAVHTPRAHTSGDIVIFADAAGIAVIGDVMWPGGFPFVDVANGGSAEGLLAALDVVLDRVGRDTVIIPGHADPVSFDDVVEYRAMVAATISAVARAKGSGRSLDQLIDDQILSDWSEWASALVPEEVWIEMVYTSTP